MTIKEQIKNVLQIARVRLEDEDSWCTNNPALDKNNKFVSPVSNKAVKFCNIGIIRNILASERYNITFTDVYNALELATISLYKDIKSPVVCNDIFGHKAVLELYDEAIRIVEYK